jgi:hypothetical protein
MTEKTTTIFTCNGCDDEVRGEPHMHAPRGWRSLTWRGGYVGDEKREAHFCGRCSASRLKALDVLISSASSKDKAA